MQKQFRLPEIWLLVLIVGLPQLSETIYTPSLPSIARTFSITNALAEYTLTIYLLGFALGTLFWGTISDHYGRKPCLLIGLTIYAFGCIGCYLSKSIEIFMISRFIQASGGSVGSILGQAICRDSFKGNSRGKVYSIIGSALAFSPAIGPVIGGLITQYSNWQQIFIYLIVLGSITTILSYIRLPETHPHKNRTKTSIIKLLSVMSRDIKVIGFGIIIAGLNGIIFSYYAEGAFYLIDILGLTPFGYGLSFVGIAAAGALGGYISKKMHDYNIDSFSILSKGITIVLFGSSVFFILIYKWYSLNMPNIAGIIITLASMVVIMIGIGMGIPNAISLALVSYKKGIGTASSLFGLFYYILISLFTLGMGILHNHTLIPMPIYFLGISLLLTIQKIILKKYYKLV